jgi:GNAT superfamily N-acetyltransferase
VAETTIRIEVATVADAPAVVTLVERLLIELGGFTAFDEAGAAALCARLLATDSYTALLARDDQGAALGVLTLQECPALYVAGAVGWIQELYVAPAARSLGVGHRLLERAADYGRQHGWRRLEVNTPAAAAWPRTVAFYEREDFAGGSVHMRRALP